MDFIGAVRFLRLAVCVRARSTERIASFPRPSLPPDQDTRRASHRKDCGHSSALLLATEQAPDHPLRLPLIARGHLLCPLSHTACERGWGEGKKIGREAATGRLHAPHRDATHTGM